MKGFEIISNGKTTKIGLGNDSLTSIILFDIHDDKQDRRIYAGGVEYEKQMRVAWFNHIPIEMGDQFQIKFTEITDISEPVKCVHDESIKRPMSKLEPTWNLGIVLPFVMMTSQIFHLPEKLVIQEIRKRMINSRWNHTTN